MLRLSLFCLLLALAVAQNGYEYNKPDRQFGATSSRPGSPSSPGGTSTPFPLRPQSDDFVGPTTGYPTGSQNYPGTSQRPGFPSSLYSSPNKPSGPGGYPGGPGGSPGGPGRFNGRPGGSPGGSGNYPDRGSPGGPGSYPGAPGYDTNSIQDTQGPPGGFPGQSDSSYPQGSRRPSGGFPGQGSRYPGQAQNYPGQGGSNFGNVGFSEDSGNYEGGDYSAIPGEPDKDYPILSYIPQTNFDCKVQQYPGYYADVETRCQVFHVCASNRTYDFLCPNGTIFSQENFVCVWWNQFNCDSAPGLFELNAKLYDYSIRGSSDSQGSNFNDYSGSKYSGGSRPQGSYYPGSGTSRPSGTYPGSFGPQGPTTPFPSVTLANSLSPSRRPFGYPSQDGRYSNGPDYSGNKPSGNGPQGPAGSYPGTQGPSGNYPSSQGPSGTYPGSQGPSSNYPNYQGAGSYPSGPQSPAGPGTQSPAGPGTQSSGYPSSTTPYPVTDSGNQGYPSGRPSGPSFPTSNGGRQPQQPNREYLPPRNKRAKHSKH